MQEGIYLGGRVEGDFLFGIRQIHKSRNYMINLKYIYIYIHYRRDKYNTYAIIENNVPYWLCGLKKHTGVYIYL